MKYLYLITLLSSFFPIEYLSAINSHTTGTTFIMNPACDTIDGIVYGESFEGTEHTFKNIISDDSTDWVVNTGPTPTPNTGPNAAKNGNNYYYLEASQTAPFSNAILISCPIEIYEFGGQFNIWYHLYGQGKLTIDISSDNGSNWISLFTNSGDLKNKWRKAEIDVSAYLNQVVRFRITGLTALIDNSDVAIDHIWLSGVGCGTDVAPIAKTKIAAAFVDELGQVSLDINSINDESTDNCGIDTMYLTQDEYNCNDDVILSTSLIVKDFDNLYDTCLAEVFVYDTLKPVISCNDTILIQLDINGNASLNVNTLDYLATDNCGICCSSISKSNFDSDDLGYQNLSYMVEDIYGNKDSCELTFNVSTPPLNPMSIRWPRHYTNIKYSGAIIECNNGSTDTTYSTPIQKITVPMSSPFECEDDPGTNVPLFCDPGYLRVGVLYEDSISFNSGPSCWTKWRKWTIIDSSVWAPSDPNATNDMDELRPFHDLTFGDCDNCPKPFNAPESHFAYSLVDEDGLYNFTQRIDVLDDTQPVIQTPSTFEVAVGMTCEGSAILSATATEFCGATQLSADALEWFIERYNQAGVLLSTKTAFGASVTMSSGLGAAGETMTIKWSANDGCGNIAVAYTYISFSDLEYSQSDSDNDGIGDACDTCPNDPHNDVDRDGICGDIDNCPSLYNPNQEPLLCDFNQYTNCRSRDSLALVAFYNTTQGYQWNNQWDLSQPISTWFGVILNESGCVSELILDNNKLKGYLPDEIGFLYDLEFLNLDNNNIQGKIPGTIQNLSNLVLLYIGANNLSGDLPDELWELSNMQYLSMGGNGDLTGQLPDSISNLTNLKILSLWGNSMTGPISTDIGLLDQLRVLSISYNRLTGNIPQNIGDLSNLQIAYLSNNQLTGSIPDTFSNLLNLRHFEVQRNNLEGSLPESIAQLENLEIFYAWDNDLSGCFPESYTQNICNIQFSFTNNSRLPFEGDFGQICYNGQSQDADNDGICSVLDCDDSADSIGADVTAPQPICQEIEVALDSFGFGYILNNIEYFAIVELVIDTVINGQDTSYYNILIEDAIDNCSKNDRLLIRLSTDSVAFHDYAVFDCDDLGTNIVYATITDLAGNTATCDLVVNVIDPNIPEACPCIYDKMMLNDTVYASNYTAQHDIMDYGTMIGASEVRYQAGNSISFNPGFEVPLGKVFEAAIDDCNNNGLLDHREEVSAKR